MNLLLIGSRGQLGFELMNLAWPRGFTIEGYDLPEFDVTRREAVAELVAAKKPLLVVNASAYTAVDKAEAERDLAFAVNRDGPSHLAEACANNRAALVHVSTDYVFAGDKIGAYVESDPVAPISVYGASKEAGEREVRSRLEQHFIVRTSWLFGRNGANFVKTMLRLAKERDELRVVDDQHGCPTSAMDLAGAIALIADRVASGTKGWGTYHYTGRGKTTWCGFAKEIVRAQAEITGRRPEVTAISTSEYPTPARRPQNSELDSSKIRAELGIETMDWRAGMRAVIDATLSGSRS
jgi:dTDP-4-dehydrorhamnose reductase